MINEQQEIELHNLTTKELVEIIIDKDDLLDKAKKFKDIVDKFNKASTLLVGSEYFEKMRIRAEYQLEEAQKVLMKYRGD